MSCFSAYSQHEMPKHKCFQHHSERRENATSLEVERIILLPNVYKLSSKVLTRRLSQIPESKQPPQQAVFHYVFITTEYVLP